MSRRECTYVEAEQYGDIRSSVKRVVITSSFSAVGRHVCLIEAEWNDPAVDAVKKLGNKTPVYVSYAAAKVLAERSAWDFMEVNKGTIGFDMVTLLPTRVWGVSP